MKTISGKDFIKHLEKKGWELKMIIVPFPFILI
jgi:predicted RNA binding protein YcfA (HicA-like mRNA interferase family)